MEVKLENKSSNESGIWSEVFLEHLSEQGPFDHIKGVQRWLPGQEYSNVFALDIAQVSDIWRAFTHN